MCMWQAKMHLCQCIDLSEWEEKDSGVLQEWNLVQMNTDAEGISAFFHY